MKSMILSGIQLSIPRVLSEKIDVFLGQNYDFRRKSMKSLRNSMSPSTLPPACAGWASQTYIVLIHKLPINCKVAFTHIIHPPSVHTSICRPSVHQLLRPSTHPLSVYPPVPPSVHLPCACAPSVHPSTWVNTSHPMHIEVALIAGIAGGGQAPHPKLAAVQQECSRCAPVTIL